MDTTVAEVVFVVESKSYHWKAQSFQKFRRGHCLHKIYKKAETYFCIFLGRDRKGKWELEIMINTTDKHKDKVLTLNPTRQNRWENNTLYTMRKSNICCKPNI